MDKCFLNLTGMDKLIKINGFTNQKSYYNHLIHNQRIDRTQFYDYSRTSIKNNLINLDTKSITLYSNLDQLKSSNELQKIDSKYSFLSENIVILYMILIGYLLTVTLIYLIWKRLNYQNLNLIKFFYMKYYEINYLQPEISMMLFKYFFYLNQNILSNNLARSEKIMFRNEILETIEKLNETPKILLHFKQSMLSNKPKTTLLNKIYSKKVKKERRQNQILENKSSTKKIGDLLIKNRLIFASLMLIIKRSFFHFLDFTFKSKIRTSFNNRTIDQINQINYQQLLDALQIRKNIERSKKILNQK